MMDIKVGTIIAIQVNDECGGSPVIVERAFNTSAVFKEWYEANERWPQGHRVEFQCWLTRQGYVRPVPDGFLVRFRYEEEGSVAKPTGAC